MLKKILLFLISSAVLSPAFSTAKEMTALEKKLYQYILDKQITNHFYPSYNGSWPTKSRVAYFADFETTSSFEIVQILLFLRSISSYASIPNQDAYNTVFERGLSQIDRYLDESRLTNEPLGTINFYPFRDLQTQQRGFPSKARDLAFKILGFPLTDADTPNDLDCSARTYTLIHDRPKNSEWSAAFPEAVNKWIDHNRTHIHKSETWKSPNSGAFLTWVEPDVSPEKASRIVGGINDVDCVVNLNVLEGLGISEQKQSLSSQTLTAKNSACAIINKMVSEGPTGSVRKCSVYYNRPSQVLLSYSRAMSSQNAANTETNCLLPSKQQAIAMAVQLAQQEAKLGRLKGSPLTKAEIVIALKSLLPLETRTPETQGLVNILLRQIRKSIKATANGKTAYVATKSPMYFFLYRGLNLDFWSTSYGNAIVLLAMVMP